MRRIASVLFLVVFLLIFSAPAFASMSSMSDQGAYQFGYTQKGQRLFNAGNNSMGLAPDWYANTGLSYSQPDILDGTALGTPNEMPAVIVAAGNTLYGFDTMLPDANDPGSFQQNQPLWSVPLAGTVPTKSHPTVADINGHFVVFIGSAGTGSGAVLQAFDVTGTFSGPGTQPKVVFVHSDPNASDIVSAPVIMQWQEHLVALYTTGDNGNIDVVTGFDDYGTGSFDENDVTFSYINLGGRTSSTIAPVLGGTAFLAGDDYSASTPYVNGPGVYLYKLDNMLELDSNGHVIVKNEHYFWYFADPNAGQGSSFSVSDDGQTAYWIDDAGNAYGINLNTLGVIFANSALSGTQNWRSPALDSQNVYFPSGDQSGTQGYLLAVSRTTGQTVWKAALPDGAAGTAPGVWEGPAGNEVMIGSGNYIDVFDASGGGYLGHIELGGGVADGTGTWYGAGVSGEFAVAGDEAVVAASNGVAAFVNEPYDFAVTKVDPGTPRNAQGNYVAQGGQKYTATVTVQDLSGPAPVSEVSVAGLHDQGGTWDSQKGQANGGTWYSADLIGKGPALPKGSMASINSGQQANDFYVALTPAGQAEQFQFNWTAPMTPETDVIGGAVDLDFATSNNPLVQDWPDINPANNLVEVPVRVEAPQLVVTPDALLQTGRTQRMTATYYPGGQDNSTGRDVTPESAWSSSDGSVAGIDATGLLTANSPGTVTITATYNGAAGTAVVRVYSSPAASSRLTFQATSQYGDYQRTPNTAKWTDSVTATLVPPVRTQTYSGEAAPPAGTVAPPEPPSGDDPGPPGNDYQDYTYVGAVATLDRWWITDGTLSYPQQNPGYSFGHPLPPAGTATVGMSPGQREDGIPDATATFKEMWAEDGTPVYDVIAGQQVGPARDYALTADYDWGLLYDDTYFWLDRRPGGGIVSEAGKNDPQGFQGSGELSGQLLVDGTGSAATGL